MKHQTNIEKAKNLITQLELVAAEHSIAKYKDVLVIYYIDFNYIYRRIKGNVKISKSQAIVEITANLTITELAISKFRELAYLAMNPAKALGNRTGISIFGDLEFHYTKSIHRPLKFHDVSNRPGVILVLTYNQVIKHLEEHFKSQT